MITFPRLGTIGRLGNHLFQIAATIGLALDHQEPYGFPRWIYEKDFRLSECFHERLPHGEVYHEPRFAYDAIPYRQGMAIEGFFQSEKYFERHTHEIRRFLTPSGPDLEPLTDTASIHVRRGDYLLLWEKHPILPMEYYSKAMELLRMQGVKRFLIFSDDLDWCRKQQWARDAEVISDLGVMEQFRMTIACRHHIMANSTFSWWTAWLDPRPGKIVVAPRVWFGAAYQEAFPTDDLFPAEWVIV